MSAGDYRLFRSENAENRSLETGVANSQKPAIGGPSASVLAILSGRRTGWVGPEDSNLHMVKSRTTILLLSAPITREMSNYLAQN